MTAILLDIVDMASLAGYVLAFILAIYIGIHLTRYTFLLDERMRHSQKLIELSEKQNEIAMAQLHLLSSIAEKSGVPLEDINEVTKDFGIEFTN